METQLEKKKKEHWTPSETYKFLAIWRENNNKLKEMGPKKELYQELAAKLAEDGVNKSGEQFKKKIENMKNLYNKYKPKVTGSSPSKWIYFNQVHEILKTNHYFNQDLAPIVDSAEQSEIEYEEIMETSTSGSTQSSISSDDFLHQTGKGKSKKTMTDIIESQSEKMTEFLKEFDRKTDKRMEELLKTRNQIQERVELIGDRMLKVLELMENKLKNN